jgi:Bifunctional DNA primase/polymerase, N-terminal
VQEHTAPGAIALTYPHRGLRIIACHWPAPAELPQFCSCGDITCPTPASHPIATLTASDATADLGQLGRWWLANPTANPATVTDERVGIIELHHPARPDALLHAMKQHNADQAPMFHVGQGVMHLLVKPKLGLDDAAVEVASHHISDIEKVVITPPGTLVLLPPAAHMTGRRIRWMRQLHHADALPTATHMLEVLTGLRKNGVLNELRPTAPPANRAP